MLQKSMKRAAMRGRAIMVRRTPKDLGQAKAGWKVSEFIKNATMARVDLYNDNPYIGVLELGARPHKVSMEGIAALHAWVWRNRHFFSSLMTEAGNRKTGKNAKKEALGIAFAIAKKIEKEGQKPTYFVRNSMDALNREFAEQLEQQLHLFAYRRARRAARRAAKAGL
jgi:hypothetical protein